MDKNKMTILSFTNLYEALNSHSKEEFFKQLSISPSSGRRYFKGDNSISIDKLNLYAEKNNLKMKIIFEKT